MTKQAEPGGKSDMQKLLDLQQDTLNPGFAERLTQMREKHGLSVDQLAKRIYTSRSTIEQYESGFLPKGEHAVALARVLECSLYWLLMGEEIPGDAEASLEPIGETPSTDKDELPRPKASASPGPAGPRDIPVAIPDRTSPDPDDFEYIPCVSSFLSIDEDAFVLSENVATDFAFRSGWLAKIASDTKNVVLMRVEGNSMEPTLREGDMVMLDIGRNRIKAGFIYALGIGGTIVIKRLEPLTGERIRIISDRNSDYPPYECKTGDVHVLGRVIWFSRRLVPPRS